MSAFIIETTGLYFNYGDGTGALQGIDLSLEKNCKVAILGPNGAGKSTFFLHCNGLLRPSSGKIKFAGQEMEYSKSYLKNLRQKVGIVFQNPDQQIFSASVRQDISFGLINMGWSKEETLIKIDQIGSQLGITDLFERPTHHLSLGQKKMVALAGVLVMNPSLLVCDEPTAGLDPAAAMALLEMLDELHQRGTAIIISTHDVDQAYSWADQIIILDQGRVLAEGEPAQVFANTGILAQARLKKPWILETWETLQLKGLVEMETPPPLTREQLFNMIFPR
ncbi:MAG: ATP-binding cassette domain-containing protein [Firmicutes bacterium]|nr:ATP-binding cassette domain-containing protein [Bacillota bacterium]